MLKILFIGNSHTYFNDMPQIFRRLTEYNGVETEVTMLAHGGMGLDFHANQPEVRFNILYGGYDFVVLQHTAHPFGEEKVFFEAANTISQMVSQTKARTLLYMTWSEKENEAGQKRMTDAYVSLSRAIGAVLAPVGEAWQAFHMAHPEVELYNGDGQHASPFGSALAACVLCTAVLERPIQAEDGLFTEAAALAWEKYQEYQVEMG